MRVLKYLLAALLFSGHLLLGQALSDLDRRYGHLILEFTKKDLTEHYYDKSFGGMDINKQFQAAEERIDSSSSLSEMYLAIARPLMDLREPHTSFIPPPAVTRMQCGFDMEMIGSECYITAVAEGSDAQQKGIVPGTQVIALNGCPPSRQVLHQRKYLTEGLGMTEPICISVLDQCHEIRTLDLAPLPVQSTHSSGAANQLRLLRTSNSMNRGPRLIRSVGDDIFIWRMQTFDVPRKTISEILDRAIEKKHLILDLRGNEGGSISALTWLAGYLSNSDLLLCYSQAADGIDSIMAIHHEKVFTGNLIVLIDSRSTSSAEVLAKTIQRTKRGIVIGDVSGGMVMKADYFPRRIGFRDGRTFGSYITTAMITLPDHSTLQNVGVYPDERILPSPDDLTRGFDPVMAHAVNLSGYALGPREAAHLFDSVLSR